MAEPHAFLKEIRSGVLIGDGAIGTALFSRGAPLQSGVERLNLTAPDIDETLHRDYIAAVNIYRASFINYREIKSLKDSSPVPYMDSGTLHPTVLGGGPEMNSRKKHSLLVR